MDDEDGLKAARTCLLARCRHGRRHRVHADHVEAEGGEQQRVLAGAAAGVEHRSPHVSVSAMRSNAGCGLPISQGGVPGMPRRTTSLPRAHLPGRRPSLFVPLGKRV